MSLLYFHAKYFGVNEGWWYEVVCGNIYLQVLEPFKVHLVEEDEILVLEFSETLLVGMGVLAIEFEGCLSDKMKGFYRR